MQMYVASYLFLLEKYSMECTWFVDFSVLNTWIKRKSEDKDFISTTEGASFSFTHTSVTISFFSHLVQIFRRLFSHRLLQINQHIFYTSTNSIITPCAENLESSHKMGPVWSRSHWHHLSLFIMSIIHVHVKMFLDISFLEVVIHPCHVAHEPPSPKWLFHERIVACLIKFSIPLDPPQFPQKLRRLCIGNCFLYSLRCIYTPCCLGSDFSLSFSVFCAMSCPPLTHSSMYW